MFGRTTPRTSFKEMSSLEKRNDGEHLSGSTQFQDREKISQVVPEHIAGHRYGIQSLSGLRAGELHGFYGIHELDIKGRGIMVLEKLFGQVEELNIMGSVLIQPEHRLGACFPGPGDSQFHPINDGVVFGLTHPVNVSFLHLMFEDELSVLVLHSDGSFALHLKGFVVGAILLRFFGHQTNVGGVSHGLIVELAIFLTVLQNGSVDSGVGTVWDDTFHVLELVLEVPHFASISDHIGHGGVDDDVAGDVEVGDAFV